ncbi:MAG: hypothetical protein CL561_12060 [Alphaproteobacteria bacterium]|nr:hypothetical protein [Alphaproteobacteria bacterium]|tara:strand:+ start:3116 stop:3997 length:882 start_codon:yes stop_codon:yes gene_type:complete
MIFEFIENSEKNKLTNDVGSVDTKGLQDVFARMSLPLPTNVQIQRTREGGFNLFLNRYAMVLRFYPYGHEAHGPHSDIGFNACDHIYHERVLPYIGCVRFPDFTMQLMPGVTLSSSFEHSELLMRDFEVNLGSNLDALVNNVGYVDTANKENPILLDTIYHPDELTQYEPYLASDQESIINNFKRYDELQTLFYNAWLASSVDNPSPMEAFWQKAQAVKEQTSLLQAGWLDSNVTDGAAFKSMVCGKGNFVMQSKNYDTMLNDIEYAEKARVNAAPPSLLSSACSKVLRVLGM